LPKALLVLALVALLLLGASAASAMETKYDPETKRIRTLLGGFPHQGGYAGWAVTFLYVMDDPRFDVRAPLPHLGLDNPMIDLQYSRKVARIYLPRSYDSFLDNVDLVVLANIDVRIFTPQNIQWFRDGVMEEGLGLTMTGGSQGFGGYGGFSSWGDTVLNDVLPVYCYEGEHPKSYTPKLRIADPENELARSLPWEEAPCFFPYNYVEPKPGCTVIIESRDEKRTLIHFYWDVGKGRCVGCQNIFGVFGCNFQDWEYFQDSVLNVYYYSAALPLPEDLLVLHEVRRKWHEYSNARKLLLSLVEFADRFNANMAPVEAELDGLNAKKREADAVYLDQEYQEALRAIEEAILETERIGELALDAKDKALLWIYVIEWLTVTGALMVAGSVTWTLMVRRAAYREVRSTRYA
jgi:uncharacterized membrane protein